MKSVSLLMIVGLALIVVACSQGANGGAALSDTIDSVVEDPIPDPTAPTGGNATSGGFVVNGGLTVPEALEYEGDGIIAVQGFVHRSGDIDRLCETLAESYPPQCGGAGLTIANPEATDNLALTEAEGVQWSQDSVTLFGRVIDGSLTIDTTVSG
jgi:hypothetical protein